MRLLLLLLLILIFANFENFINIFFDEQADTFFNYKTIHAKMILVS